MARYQQYVVEQVENGFLVMPNRVDGPEDLTWVATDLDGLLDVLHTVFEQEEGPRGAPFVVSGAGPSSVEEAAHPPQGDAARSASAEDAPSTPPPAPDAAAAAEDGPSASDPPPGSDQPEAEMNATVDLSKYPRVTKAPTGKFSMMCPEHGAHTAVIRAEELVCTGRTGAVWCKESVPMPVVRLMLGEVAG